ncbi:MAG: penicillin-binding protein 2 [Lachnospiraceae bacterium]|nr:penicillin-binding protein 2 [Candidatus Colinaster equi]
MSKLGKRKRGKIECIVTISMFGLAFIGLIVYLLIFVKDNQKELISNNYNSRQKLLASENTRGTIFDSTGEIIACTKYDEDGKEYRCYPMNELYSHAVGYSTKGKTGIESSANYYLINSDIPLNEKVENEIAGKKNPGNCVYTTFDTNLQQVASNALGVCKGAIVVSEVKTGRILCMVSKPDFDPNTVAADWDKYVNDDESSVLLNRVMQGLYPPGSTFKIVTALEYIREHPNDYKEYSYVCNGKYKKDDIDISCFHGSNHGSEDFVKSFAKSCNSSFTNIGLSLDKNKYGKTINELMFNSKLPLDYNYNIPKLEVDENVSDYNIAQIAIGQGQASITPILLNMITNAIANDGVVMKPRTVDKITDVHGNDIIVYKDEEYAEIMTADEADKMTELMKAVVTDGTGTKLLSDNYTAAGKTGSAEFNSVKEDSHAWFTGFVPADNPQISVTVIVESIGSGGDYAVPIAKRIIDAYEKVD